MAEENVMAEVINLLETEPAPAVLPAAFPAVDIPALREQLAILVSTGKCKEAIGVNLTHEQVRRLEDKDVIRHSKRYETYVGARTTETLIESFLTFSTKALGWVVKLKDAEALQNELKNDYIITKELSNLSVQSFFPTKTIQWLSVISIIVSLVGLYYKREEIKGVFFQKAATTSDSAPSDCKKYPQHGLNIFTH